MQPKELTDIELCQAVYDEVVTGDPAMMDYLYDQIGTRRVVERLRELGFKVAFSCLRELCEHALALVRDTAHRSASLSDNQTHR